MAIDYVTSDKDDGSQGTLREVLANAVSGDIIKFALPAGDTIDLNSTLVITKNITIDADPNVTGSPQITLDGGGKITDIDITSGARVLLEGLTITNGNATGATGGTGKPGGTGGAAAGGIYVANGALTLLSSSVTNNHATGGYGGAANYAVYRSTGGGAGGNAAGGIYVKRGSLTLYSNDTFSGNYGTGGHGAPGAKGYSSSSPGNHPGGGAGGAGGQAGGSNGEEVLGQAGSNGGNTTRYTGGKGGGPGQAGGTGGGQAGFGYAGGGGGGGGTGFANYNALTRRLDLVTNLNDSGTGSLRNVLASAQAGDTIAFAASLDGGTVHLLSSLAITKNVTVDAGVSASNAPNITLSGNNSFTDIIVGGSGVTPTVTLEGLAIINGSGQGSAGADGIATSGSGVSAVGGVGGSAAGGILVESGALNLRQDAFQNNRAIGGSGGSGYYEGGGGAGGNAAAAIYVEGSGTLTLYGQISFSGNAARGGKGGTGGNGRPGLGYSGGVGGGGNINGPGSAGSSGTGGSKYPGAGGAPGHSGYYGNYAGPGGGGGGGTGFANFNRAIDDTLIVTNLNDSGTGSLRAALAAAVAGDVITFQSGLSGAIDLNSTLVISKNLTIDGLLSGSTPLISIDGQNAVTDLQITGNAVVTMDGLIITDGKGQGPNGFSFDFSTKTGNSGGPAAGGVMISSGYLFLENAVVSNNTATGGNGAQGGSRFDGYGGGGAGGGAAGGIYIAEYSSVGFNNVTFNNNTGIGGNGGPGGGGPIHGGAGGQGGTSQGHTNVPGQPGAYFYYAPGGAPGQPGPFGGGGGGGGEGFADVGGLGIACFCRGTLLRMPGGEVPVEELAIGGRVMTFSGEAKPIRWIGRRAYDGRFIAGNRRVLPIRIAAGAIADGVPSRDLHVSPGHALYIDSVLVQAEHIVNGATIVQAEMVDAVEYFHIELDAHDIVFADGAPAETFTDCDNRYMFANGAEYAALYPEDRRATWDFCAPRLEREDAALTGIRAALLERAASLGHALERNPDLRLIVGGVVIRPETVAERHYRFAIPAGSEDILLASRSSVPAEIAADGRDLRRLGIPIERIVLRDPDLAVEARHTHPALRDGFHGAEPGHRWTDGRGRLPAALLQPFAGPFTLDLYLAPSELAYRHSANQIPKTALRRKQNSAIAQHAGDLGGEQFAFFGRV